MRTAFEIAAVRLGSGGSGREQNTTGLEKTSAGRLGTGPALSRGSVPSCLPAKLHFFVTPSDKAKLYCYRPFCRNAFSVYRKGAVQVLGGQGSLFALYVATARIMPGIQRR